MQTVLSAVKAVQAVQRAGAIKRTSLGRQAR
jgi:hypothetical protein